MLSSPQGMSLKCIFCLLPMYMDCNVYLVPFRNWVGWFRCGVGTHLMWSPTENKLLPSKQPKCVCLCANKYLKCGI
jgi:hypothetical protein